MSLHSNQETLHKIWKKKKKKKEKLIPNFLLDCIEVIQTN